MVEKNKYFHIAGKRKMSIARATIGVGNGTVRINSVNLEAYPNETARSKMSEPMLLAGDLAGKVNVSVNVFGGGEISRAEAARNAIARAMVKYFGEKTLKRVYLDYDRHLLVADTRRTEPNKPCRSAPRRSKQTSKR